VYSELSLLAVEICKVDQSPISIAEDLSWVIRGIEVNRDWTWGARRGLHANLMVLLCVSDHKRASVLGWRMVEVRAGR
jgi:hypothetical protein